MAPPGWRTASAAKLFASPQGYRRFMSDRFGFSVHWGLYSIGANKEWLGALEKIPRDEYAKLKERFNPVHFNADEWIGLAHEAGCTAFMVTTKHHDGFCLFDSKHTDFSTMYAPCKRDIIAELVAACRKYDMAVHLYHSLIDWHHPLSSDCEFRPAKDFNGYCKYMLAQITELCTNYGHIDGFLFDGWWPDAKASDDQVNTVERCDWPLTEIYDLIHRLQPDCMITNNHHILPLKGEDYQVWELDLPGRNTTGFNCEKIGDKPTVAWITSHEGWSWQKKEVFKKPEEICSFLDQCNAMKASLFYNVGPMGDGRIDPKEVAIMKEIGRIRGSVI
jgi:alpha-L-fucosidase